MALRLSCGRYGLAGIAGMVVLSLWVGACRPSRPTNGAGPGRAVPVLPPVTELGDSSRLGVWLGGGDTAAVGLLRATGAKWTRVEVAWNAVEQTYAEPPIYRFEAYDALLANLGAAGINTVVGLRGNPSWSADTHCGPIRRMDRFGEFLRALVGRYKDAPYNVKHWEFYNEAENRSVKWGDFLGGCFGNYPNKYVEMLQVASENVKAADPEAKIVFGGIAMGQHVDPQEGPIFNDEFFPQVLGYGGGAFFDIANVHYFSSQNGAWGGQGSDIAGKPNAMRAIMAQYNVVKPVMVTELSWTSSAKDSSDYQEVQARYVPKALARGLSADLYAMTWFCLMDWSGADYPYGLTDVNRSPRRSYEVFRVAAAEFGAARTVRRILPEEVSFGEATVALEGYAFDVGGQQRWVLWLDGGQVLVKLPPGALEALDKLGQAIPLIAEGGATAVSIDDSPVYVRFAPALALTTDTATETGGENGERPAAGEPTAVVPAAAPDALAD